MANNVIILYPTVSDTPLFIATKKFLASREVAQKDKEAGLLACLSSFEKRDIKLEVVK